MSNTRARAELIAAAHATRVCICETEPRSCDCLFMMHSLSPCHAIAIGRASKETFGLCSEIALVSNHAGTRFMPILECTNAINRIKWTFLVYIYHRTRIKYGCFPQDQ